ncbi:MAG: 50S ribosomal protein L18 [Rickettsiaceae bacterium]
MRSVKDKFFIRQRRVRAKLAKCKDSSRCRLSIFKSNRHLHAQIIDDVNSRTLVCASTLDSSILKPKASNCNLESAKKLGDLLAKKAEESNIKYVAFDRGGYKYHGIVKVFADAARSVLIF